jgi:cell division protein FtsQ
LRPSRGRWPATILVGLTLIAAAAWWVTNTPLFDMRTLRVSGNRHLSDTEVARLAGLSRTTNVMWLRTGALADRIEQDPWVLRAKVSRTLPGTVTVSIHERRPVAIVEAGRSSLLVSGDGVILGSARPKTRLPAITLAGAPVAVGSRISGLPAVLIVARSLPAGVRSKVARITQARPGALTLILRDGAKVLYGDASETDAKGRALSSLLSWASKRGIRPDYIDVRAPAAPALLPLGAVPSS